MRTNHKLRGRRESPLFWLTRGGVFGGLFFLLVALFLPRGLPEYDLKVGEISPREIIAPISFPVLKTTEVLARDQREAQRQVFLVVDEDATLTRTLEVEPKLFFDKVQRLRHSDEFFERKKKTIESWGVSLSPETISQLLSSRFPARLQEEVEGSARELLRQGILPASIRADRDTMELVLLRREGHETRAHLGDFLTTNEVEIALSHRAKEVFPSQKQAATAYVEVTRAFVDPNLTVNQEETDRRRSAARQSVSLYEGWVNKGERIVGRGERVTMEHLQKIRSLEAGQKTAAYGGSVLRLVLPPLARALLVGLLLLVLVGYLIAFRPREFEQDHSVFTIASIALLQIIVFKAMTLQDAVPPYLIPLPCGAILGTMLFDFQLGMVLTAVLALLLTGLSGFSLSFALVALLGSSVAAFSVQRLRHRSEFLRTLLVLTAANILGIASLELMRLVPPDLVLQDVGVGALQAFLSVGLATLSLPIFEHAFGLVTSPSLLELADFNRPLLKRLSVEASGTYRHSMLVSSLAEAGCETIGANSLLARVAAYYHDIGKIIKPEYFIENQIGMRNRHDKLTPKMSSLVLISHVREGVTLAQKERLPQIIRDGIEQHHGTSLLAYFYHKARRLANPSEEEVFEADYRYPGPKPQRREFGVIMLADAVEAASRAIRDPNPGRLQGLAKKVIMDKFNEMELDECNLTLKDLHRIGESFLPILVAFFHPRLDYPQEEGNENRH